MRLVVIIITILLHIIKSQEDEILIIDIFPSKTKSRQSTLSAIPTVSYSYSECMDPIITTTDSGLFECANNCAPRSACASACPSACASACASAKSNAHIGYIDGIKGKSTIGKATMTMTKTTTMSKTKTTTMSKTKTTIMSKTKTKTISKRKIK